MILIPPPPPTEAHVSPIHGLQTLLAMLAPSPVSPTMVHSHLLPTDMKICYHFFHIVASI